MRESSVTHREIDSGSNHERPVPAQVSVGNIGPERRSHPNGPYPVGDIVGRPDGPLMELLCQVEDKV